MQHMQTQHMQVLCMETAYACGCLSLVTQTCAKQQCRSTDKAAPNSESSLITNIMFCIHYMSACRLRQVIYGGLLVLMHFVVRNDAHGAVDSWLILEVVSMAVLQNVATSNVVVIILQLGKVQSWLALKRKGKTIPVGVNLTRSQVLYRAAHMLGLLCISCMEDDRKAYAHSMCSNKAHTARHDTLLLL